MSLVFYHPDTPIGVIDVLEAYRYKSRRLRLFLGDRETGRDWGEEYSVTGYIGLSCGPVKVPLLVHNSRSLGGGVILTHCIVKIIDTTSKRILYQHSQYSQPCYTIGPPPERIGKVDMLEAGYTTGVYADGDNVANFKTHWQAERYVAFMLGKRMCK